MGILESKLDSESKNYIKAICAIEFIAKYTKDDHIVVAKYLLNTGFDQYVESYTRDTFYKFHLDETIDNNGAYLKTFTILKTIIELNPFSYDEKLTLNSFNFPELREFEDCYWRKDKFFSSPMIIDMNFNAAQLEEMQSEFKPNLDIAGFLEGFTKNIGVDAPIHIVKMFNQDSYTIEEASLFVHSNVDEQGSYHFGIEPNKHNLDLITDFIKSGSLVIEKDGSIGKENLKNFLRSIDVAIKGFNENCELLESLKQSIEIDKLKVTIEKLKAELAEKDQKIKEIESLKPKNDMDLLSLIFDESATEIYAPDLANAIKLWKHLYVENKGVKDSHSSRANHWISKNTPYEGESSVEMKRLREVTSPFNSWHNERKIKLNK